MKTYLEIKVPIRFGEEWFEDLRDVLDDVTVTWQKGFYHITMVFLDFTPTDVDLRPILRRHLEKAPAPVITFDKLDAFSTRSDMHIINMTASKVPEDFLALIEALRTDLKEAGCKIQSGFKLHVTLGRVKDPSVRISELKQMMSSVDFPTFTLTLTDVDFRVFRGETVYETTLV